MKKADFDLLILIWTSLLVLLVSGWCVKEFFNWDTTIIGAIIAFIGAIFGGLITLLGVRYTIDNNNLLEERRANKEALMYLYPFIRELERIEENVIFHFFEEHYSAEDIVRECYKEFSYDSKLFDYAQRSSGQLYHHLMLFKEEIIDFYMKEIYNQGRIFEMTDDSVVEEIGDKLSDLIDSVREEINKRRQYITIQ